MNMPRSFGGWGIFILTVNAQASMKRKKGGQLHIPSEKLAPLTKQKLDSIHDLIENGKYREALAELESLESSQLTNFIHRKSSSFLTLEIGFIHYLSALALFKLGKLEGLKEVRIAIDVLYKLGEKDVAKEIIEEINDILKSKMIVSTLQTEKQAVELSG